MAQDTATESAPAATLEDIARATREILALVSDEVVLPSECMPSGPSWQYRAVMYTQNASANGYMQLDWYGASGTLRLSLWAGGQMWYARQLHITEVVTNGR